MIVDSHEFGQLVAKVAALTKRVEELEGRPLLRCRCGRPVEKDRECYATPTCHACLPPPPPLPVEPWPTAAAHPPAPAAPTLCTPECNHAPEPHAVQGTPETVAQLRRILGGLECCGGLNGKHTVMCRPKRAPAAPAETHCYECETSGKNCIAHPFPPTAAPAACRVCGQLPCIERFSIGGEPIECASRREPPLAAAPAVRRPPQVGDVIASLPSALEYTVTKAFPQFFVVDMRLFYHTHEGITWRWPTPTTTEGE